MIAAPNGYLVELLEFASEKDEGRVSGSAGAIGAIHFAITVNDIQHAQDVLRQRAGRRRGRLP